MTDSNGFLISTPTITTPSMTTIVQTSILCQLWNATAIFTFTSDAVQNATVKATTTSITVNSGHAKVAANASVGQREAMT